MRPNTSVNRTSNSWLCHLLAAGYFERYARYASAILVGHGKGDSGSNR